jgi:hypothetical protein
MADIDRQLDEMAISKDREVSVKNARQEYTKELFKVS